MTTSNVINLAERRSQKLQPVGPVQEPRRRGSVLAAGGYTLLLPAVAFLGFVAYNAIRLEMLGHPFVVGLMLALAAYIGVGASLARFGKRLLPVRAIQQESTIELAADEALVAADEEPDNILEFPAPGTSTSLISIYCSWCADRYTARPSDLTCPTCGRAALAG